MVPFQITRTKIRINISVYFLTYFILCLLVDSSKLSARGINFKEGKTSSVIPFQNVKGLIILPFQIGEEKVNLILDTGTRNIILFEKPGNYGLKPEPGKHILFSGIGKGNIIKGKYATEVKIQAADIEGSGLTVVIIPSNGVSKNLGVEINGLIGYDIFLKFLVTINYIKNELVFSKPEKIDPVGFSHQMDLMLKDTKPYINSSLSIPGVDEQSYSFFIDTGAGLELVLNHDPYKGIKKKKNVILGRGLTGNIKGRAHLIKDFYIGDFYFANFSVYIPSSGVYMDKELMADRDGTLGGKFLQRFDKVAFDYSNKKIYFQQRSLLAKR